LAQIEDILTFLLIWGEAANLRHTPECLCFLYHKTMQTHQNFNSYTEHLYPGYFLDHVVTPIYEVIATALRSKGDHEHRKTYDDFNEFFWSPKCLRFSLSDYSKEDLEEAYNVIRFLKGKINEVNLLNAKLLYSNKLFRNFSLNEGQKMKVIENFDRAHNLREVKLVYSTLAEGFKMPSTKKVVKESFASKPVASTKPAKQVISEGTELANRFKKLAGLK
jgi:hypothetical protein